MVTYTDSRGSRVTSVDPAAIQLAPGDAIVRDPNGNAFVTSQANAAAMTKWLQQRASGVNTPCPVSSQSSVSPVAPGTALLPGNQWVYDRYGYAYQTTPDQAEGLKRYIDSRERPLQAGYEYVQAGGMKIPARSDMLAALGDPSNPKYHEARSYYSGLLSTHGLTQRTGDANGNDSSQLTWNQRDVITGLWSRNPTNTEGNTPRSEWNFRQIAEDAAKNRPGYYGLPGEGLDPARTIGDSRSDALASGLYALGISGFGPFKTKEQATLGALEVFRSLSYGSGNTRAAQYYSGEMQKTAERSVEKASEYHFLGMASGVPVPANPWEYQADMAVEFMKGTPQKSSEWFSPVSGQMSPFLPGGIGLQQWSWNVALNTDNPKYTKPENVSFMPAVMRLGATEGQYGPYGSLFGGPSYVGTPSSDGMRRQADTQFTPDVFARIDRALGVVEKQRGPMERSDPLPYLTITNAIGMGAGEGRIRGSKTIAGEFTLTPLTGTTAPVTTTTPSFFDDIGGFFRTAPIVSMFYDMGTKVPKNATASMDSFFKSTPFFESIYKGGGAFVLKGEYEKQSANAMRTLDPMLKSYEGNVTAYNRDISGFNTRVAEYEKNKTESGYWSLKTEESRLLTRKTELDRERSSIDTIIAPITALETRYKSAAAGMTGNVNQESLYSFGIGSWLGGVSKGYQKIIEEPINKFGDGFGLFGKFAGGVAAAPRTLIDLGQMSLIGGETIVRSAKNAPGLATAGMAMQIQGLKQQAEENPAGLAGTIVGMFVIGSAAGAVTSRAIGAARTSGKQYVPIENIGYDSKYGFPVKPNYGAARELIRGFGEGKLFPAPRKMSITDDVPYLHGEGGVPTARLPTHKPGDVVLWTAHDAPKIMPRSGVKVGEAYKLTGEGTSELAGISAAPVAEGYFAKVGGQIPRMIGFESPIKMPTMYSTIAEGLETIPARVKARLPRDANGKITDYTAVNEYMWRRLSGAPGGQAFIPMLKSEYEANIPMGSIFEVTGKNYYTKIGGFGKNHLFGVRVPIIEQNIVGFETPNIARSTVPSKSIGESYNPSPLLNLAYGYPSSLFGSASFTLPSTGKPYAGSRKTIQYRTGYSTPTPTRTPAYRSRASNYELRYGRESVYKTSGYTSLAASSVLSELKSIMTPSTVRSRPYSLSMPKSFISAPRSATSSPRSPRPTRGFYSLTDLTRPQTPRSTKKPTTTTPWSPFLPTTPTPIIPLPFFGGSNGPVGSEMKGHRIRAHKEIIPIRSWLLGSITPLRRIQKRPAPKKAPRKKR